MALEVVSFLCYRKYPCMTYNLRNNVKGSSSNFFSVAANSASVLPYLSDIHKYWDYLCIDTAHILNVLFLEGCMYCILAVGISLHDLILLLYHIRMKN